MTLRGCQRGPLVSSRTCRHCCYGNRRTPGRGVRLFPYGPHLPRQPLPADGRWLTGKDGTMLAVWYDRTGPAADVVGVGELPAPEPGPGEVRVLVSRSGANPGDTKKRRGWLGSSMAFPRVIPHGDGAGVVESVGGGADPAMLFDNITVRLLGSDDFPPLAKQQAAADLTTAAREGALHVTIDTLLPLEQTTRAHDPVDECPRGPVLLAVPGGFRQPARLPRHGGHC